MVNRLFNVQRKTKLSHDEAVARVLPFIAAAMYPNEEKLISNLFTGVTLDATMIERVWNSLSEKDQTYLTELSQEVAGLVFAAKEGILE